MRNIRKPNNITKENGDVVVIFTALGTNKQECVSIYRYGIGQVKAQNI